MSVYEELAAFYPQIIAGMPQRFNSHEFILALAHQHQHLYIKALAQYADDPHSNPFQATHSVLARMLKQFPNLVYYVGQEPNSRDIFGNTSDAALWVKLE